MQLEPKEKLVLDENEASKALGVSIDDLKRLVSSGTLPNSFICGESIRVRRASVIDLLAERNAKRMLELRN